MEGTDGGIEGVTCDGFFRHPHCDSTCDGLELSIYSNCCENGAFYPCDDGNLCINGNTNKGIFSGDMVLPDYSGHNNFHIFDESLKKKSQ